MSPLMICVTQTVTLVTSVTNTVTKRMNVSPRFSSMKLMLLRHRVLNTFLTINLLLQLYHKLDRFIININIMNTFKKGQAFLDSCYVLGNCVPLTVLIVLLICRNFRDKGCPKISKFPVSFAFVKEGTPVKNPKILPEIFAKQANVNVRNLWLNMNQNYQK